MCWKEVRVESVRDYTTLASEQPERPITDIWYLGRSHFPPVHDGTDHDSQQQSAGEHVCTIVTMMQFASLMCEFVDLQFAIIMCDRGDL